MTEYSTSISLIEHIEKLSEKHKIYIVGAGRYGKIIGKYFNMKKISWAGYIDKDDSLIEVNGKKVFGYDLVGKKDHFYLVSSEGIKAELIQQLLDRGVNSKSIGYIGDREILFDIYANLVNWKEYTVKIKQFKDKYKGKRCFVIGNGPSLTIEDLEKTQNEYTFACNSIYAIYKYTKWRPTFYCALDRYFSQEKMNDRNSLNEVMDECVAAFTSVESEAFQFRNTVNNIFFLKTNSQQNLETNLPFFSSDCSENVYVIGSILYVMLQLAVYMGFQEIVLLGVDFSFSVERKLDGSFKYNKVQNHMDIMEKSEKGLKFRDTIKKLYGHSYFADTDKQYNGYSAAKKYTDSHGIKIYNATRGGKLEIFPRVDFDTLFEE